MYRVQESVEWVKLIKWIKWTPFSSIRHTLVKWSNGIMLCIIPRAGVSRMGQIDQMDQMDSIFFHSTHACQMVKWYHAVYNTACRSQSNGSN